MVVHLDMDYYQIYMIMVIDLDIIVEILYGGI